MTPGPSRAGLIYLAAAAVLLGTAWPLTRYALLHGAGRLMVRVRSGRSLGDGGDGVAAGAGSAPASAPARFAHAAGGRPAPDRGLFRAVPRGADLGAGGANGPALECHDRVHRAALPVGERTHLGPAMGGNRAGGCWDRGADRALVDRLGRASSSGQPCRAAGRRTVLVARNADRSTLSTTLRDARSPPVELRPGDACAPPADTGPRARDLGRSRPPFR